METIRGKTSLDLDLNGFTTRLTNYDRVILDLGTGDGKFAFHYARAFPRHFVIGVDACRENLREHSRVKLPNALFIIASAQSLPNELNGLFSHITINFPWGSMLESLLSGDPRLLCGLKSVSRARAAMDLRINGGALAEARADAVGRRVSGVRARSAGLRQVGRADEGKLRPRGPGAVRPSIHLVARPP